MIPWMKRASLSAPPPLPAMITNSTGFFGNQPAAKESDVMVVVKPRPTTALSPIISLVLVMLSSPYCKARFAYLVLYNFFFLSLFERLFYPPDMWHTRAS